MPKHSFLLFSPLNGVDPLRYWELKNEPFETAAGPAREGGWLGAPGSGCSSWGRGRGRSRALASSCPDFLHMVVPPLAQRREYPPRLPVSLHTHPHHWCCFMIDLRCLNWIKHNPWLMTHSHHWTIQGHPYLSIYLDIESIYLANHPSIYLLKTYHPTNRQIFTNYLAIICVLLSYPGLLPSLQR